jgi:phage tail sheath protein FI
VKGYDTTNRMIVDLPPSAPAIRTYIYNDIVGETWFAPAGLNRGRIVEATGIERTLTQGERDYLYENGVNPIANFSRYGVVIWGQKTLQALPTALDRVNVRRLMLYLRKVIASAVQGLLFEPNTPRLWRRFIALVTPTLEGIQDREGLNGFQVRCDATTNTPDVIDRSEFRAKIGIKPTKAAEFIIIDFVLVNQSSNFSEIVAATFS